MKRIILAADEEKDTRFEDGCSELEDDFSYLIDGLNKLDRDNSTLEALKIIEDVSASINNAIAAIASTVKSVQGDQ